MRKVHSYMVVTLCVLLLVDSVVPQRFGGGGGGGRRRGGRRQGGRRGGGQRQNRQFGNFFAGGRPGRPFRPVRPHRPSRPGQAIGGGLLGGIASAALIAGGQVLNQLAQQGNFGGRPHGGFGGRPHGGFGGRPHGGFGGRPQGGFGGGGFGGRPQGGFGGRPQGGFGGGSFGGRPQGGFGNNFVGSSFQNPIHPGQCPLVRPSCPPTRLAIRPGVCNSDIICGPREKCCFDICLQHSTCKAAI